MSENNELSKEYKGFKPFDTLSIERTREIAVMVKDHIHKRCDAAPFGVRYALIILEAKKQITHKEYSQVFLTLFNYGVQHGKIASDIDPTMMYWFDPYHPEHLRSYLDYFIDNFGKEVGNATTSK